MIKENYFSQKIKNINVKKIQSNIFIRNDIKFIKSKSSLLVLDMQNYFLFSESNAFIPSSLEIINNINNLIKYFKKNKRPVIITQHCNKKNSLMDLWWRNNYLFKNDFLHIHKEIDTKKCIIIKKNYYDAFHKTKLEKILKEFFASQLVITGVVTHICCDTTARSAFIRGFLPFIPLDATADYNLDLHVNSLINLSHCCSVITKTINLLNGKT